MKDAREAGWRVVQSHIVVDTPHLRLRRDEIELPSGRRVGPYYVRESRGFCIVFALTPDARVVLVHQYKHGIGRYVLELPAGGIDPGELPAACARRELAEETGYVGDPPEPNRWEPTSSIRRVRRPSIICISHPMRGRPYRPHSTRQRTSRSSSQPSPTCVATSATERSTSASISHRSILRSNDSAVCEQRHECVTELIVAAILGVATLCVFCFVSSRSGGGAVLRVAKFREKGYNGSNYPDDVEPTVVRRNGSRKG